MGIEFRWKTNAFEPKNNLQLALLKNEPSACFTALISLHRQVSLVLQIRYSNSVDVLLDIYLQTNKQGHCSQAAVDTSNPGLQPKKLLT